MSEDEVSADLTLLRIQVYDEAVPGEAVKVMLDAPLEAEQVSCEPVIFEQIDASEPYTPKDELFCAVPEI